MKFARDWLPLSPFVHGVSVVNRWSTARLLELATLDNPIRREFHLFTLLSGCRPSAQQQIKPSHVDFRRRILHIPKPKGGAKRAFDIPLSREMILCLVRAMRFGRQMYPSQAAEWVFPADSASGHLTEQKEDRSELSKWGNDLRQSFRTVATAAGVSEIDAKLLMNHAIPGVNAGYITRHKLLEDHLRTQQQAVRSAVFAALGKPLSRPPAMRDWVGPRGGRQAVLATIIHQHARNLSLTARQYSARPRELAYQLNPFCRERAAANIQMVTGGDEGRSARSRFASQLRQSISHKFRSISCRQAYINGR